MTAFVLVLLILISFPAAGAESIHQVDWVPNNFLLVCLDGQPCYLNAGDDETVARMKGEKVARMMSEAVEGMKKMPFSPPVDWGDRKGQGTSNDYIELYQVGNGIAAAAPRCGQGAKRSSRMVVGPGFWELADREYLSYYFMAHEIFHLIQYSYPFWDQQICSEHVPGWIMESMATAVGLEVMRKRYPSVVPSRRSDREARQFSGLRHYDEPLPRRQISYENEEMSSGDHPLYWTSSFWRHIANAHHRGSPVAAIQPRWMNALPSSPIKNRSPRVVAMGSNPRRSTLGDTTCQTAIPASISTMGPKKTAVGSVQAIQLNQPITLSPGRSPWRCGCGQTR